METFSMEMEKKDWGASESTNNIFNGNIVD